MDDAVKRAKLVYDRAVVGCQPDGGHLRHCPCRNDREPAWEAVEKAIREPLESRLEAYETAVREYFEARRAHELERVAYLGADKLIAAGQRMAAAEARLRELSESREA